MGRQVIAYDAKDFKGGEFGRIGAAAAPKGTFTATNMLVNFLGELMVRPGVINITPSGVANGVLHAYGNTPVPSNDLFYIQGTAVRTFASGGSNLKTSGTALAEVPSEACDWKTDGATILVASPADKIYRITPQGGATVPTVAGLTGSPGAGCIEIYGDRIVAGDIDGSNDYRLRFSGTTADIPDPNVWNSDDWIDVGDAFFISGLHSQRQHLLIQKQNQMHVLTGVPGVNPVLRKVYSGQGPLHPLEARLGPRDNVWYLGLFNKFPSSFNGSTPYLPSHLEFTSTASDGAGNRGVAMIGENGDDGVVCVSGADDRIALFLNGVWTFHTMAVNLSGFVCGGARVAHLVTDGTVSTPPAFYTWNPCADTPGIEGGDRMRAGDASSTSLSGSVSFPEWWSEDGAEVTVREVIVDFKSFATGSATNNHFDLAVSALRRYGAGAAQASTTVSFDEAAASSSASGTLQRKIFGFGEQGRGNGYQLAFSACKGIAIQRITVVLDAAPVRV